MRKVMLSDILHVCTSCEWFAFWHECECGRFWCVVCIFCMYFDNEYMTCFSSELYCLAWIWCMVWWYDTGCCIYWRRLETGRDSFEISFSCTKLWCIFRESLRFERASYMSEVVFSSIGGRDKTFQLFFYEYDVW